MRSPASLALIALVFGVTSSIHAQGASGPRAGLEVTGGLTVPLGNSTDDWDTGTHFGANLLVDVTRMIGVYGGYMYTQLPFSGSDANLALKGFEGGVRVNPGLAIGPITPILTLGATFLKPEVSDNPTGGDVEGERKLGYRVGLGFDIPLGQLLTASFGVAGIIDPLDKIPPIPDCHPSDPECDGPNLFQTSVGLRVYPPFLSRGPFR